jgi:glycosyltransferase involved in cell wall biosynthesis
VAFEEHAQDGSFVTISVFDPNITENSPAGSCLLQMLRAAEDSYDLRVFTSRTDLEASERVVIYKIPTPKRPVFLQNMVFTLLASVLYLARGQKQSLKISTQGAFPFCEIAYAHNPHKLFLTRYRKHISGGLPTRTARLVNYWWIALMESIAFKQARVIVVPSRGLANQLADTYGEGIAAKLRVIPNPVDCKAFAAGMKPAVPRPFTFAFCALGNFEWKGLRLVIEALAGDIAADLKVIGGNESEIRGFRKVAQAAGVADRVTFVGLQRDIRPYLWSSDVFVFPSLHESFGLVCLQAAAAGLPLITTELYALDELLQPGISGWKVERTIESVRQAMRAAIADRERTEQMGRNAQVLAQQYDTLRFAERWDGMLRTGLA